MQFLPNFEKTPVKRHVKSNTFALPGPLSCKNAARCTHILFNQPIQNKKRKVIISRMQFPSNWMKNEYTFELGRQENILQKAERLCLKKVKKPVFRISIKDCVRYEDVNKNIWESTLDEVQNVLNNRAPRVLNKRFETNIKPCGDRKKLCGILSNVRRRNVSIEMGKINKSKMQGICC